MKFIITNSRLLLNKLEGVKFVRIVKVMCKIKISSFSPLLLDCSKITMEPIITQGKDRWEHNLQKI